ncbi:hypothetical protein [Calothrix sp. NIES-2100]|uniref:hypothetical protein n=1 Tax=Calothrix sp. NIES-2100 TaxID=1954172 RepID=UPI0030DCFAAE
MPIPDIKPRDSLIVVGLSECDTLRSKADHNTKFDKVDHPRNSGVRSPNHQPEVRKYANFCVAVSQN